MRHDFRKIKSPSCRQTWVHPIILGTGTLYRNFYTHFDIPTLSVLLQHPISTNALQKSHSPTKPQSRQLHLSMPIRFTLLSKLIPITHQERLVTHRRFVHPSEMHPPERAMFLCANSPFGTLEKFIYMFACLVTTCSRWFFINMPSWVVVWNRKNMRPEM